MTKAIFLKSVLLAALFVLPHNSTQAAHVSCPTQTAITTPVDIIFVFDDSEYIDNIEDQIAFFKDAAVNAVDAALKVSESRVGLISMYDTVAEMNLSEDEGALKGNISGLKCSGQNDAPLMTKINKAAEMLSGGTNKDVIIFFPTGVPISDEATPLSAAATAMTRAGVVFSSASSTVSSLVETLVSDPSLARKSSDPSDLSEILSEIISQVTETGDSNQIDHDGDGRWPDECADVPDNVCGNPAFGSKPCDDYYDMPQDIDSSLTDPAASAIDSSGASVTINDVLNATKDNLDGDSFNYTIDTYENPLKFTLSLSTNNIPAPLDGVNKGWLQLFKDAGKADLDRDGVDVKDGRVGAAVSVPTPSGTDWYDNPFTTDATGATLEQLRQTLNDLDLDSFPRCDAMGLSPPNPSCEDAASPNYYDRKGNISPGAIEGACTAPRACTAAVPDPATGRIPPNFVSLGPPGAVFLHPWDVQQIEAYYGCGLTPIIITSGQPPNPDPGGAGTRLSMTYQCKDGIDNDLDGLMDSAEEGCDIARDLDGDGAVAATHADCVDPERCDFYDNPDQFGNDLRSANPAGDSRCWLEVFKTTANDLDGDGLKVAQGRTGEKETVTFVQLPPTPPTSYDPAFKWQDWYDNPFASSFPHEPTLAQLAGTTNDMDWDTFISEDWGKKFIDAAKSWWQMANWEPDSAEVVPGLTGNVGGCVYPNPTGPPYLEGTCASCQVNKPDTATGRMPPGKAAPSNPMTLNPPQVCQTEAYYADLVDADPPYETICPNGCDATVLDALRPLTTLVAQCRDSKDNDLNDLTDGRDNKCPITGGIVACGRYADDYKTAIDESAPCTLCHFFYLFERVMNNFVWRIVPLVALAFIVWGGFLFVTSAGNPKRITDAKNVLVWTFSGYVVILISWIAVNTTLAKLGVNTWTGFTSQQGTITSITPDGLTICDSSQTWTGDGADGTKDPWENIAISISKSDDPKLVGQVRIIESNTTNCVALKNAFETAPAIGDEFTIGGWWQFICEAK